MVKQPELNIQTDEKIVNKKTKEEFTLKNATIYGGYNIFSDYLSSNGLDRFIEQELATFCFYSEKKWLLIPAKLLRGSRQLTLKLSDWYPYRDAWSSYRQNLAST